MFQLFSSIKDEKSGINVGGIGLGLVISKMIVNKFNGDIDFESTYKKGSNFYFTFENANFSDDEVDMKVQVGSLLEQLDTTTDQRNPGELVNRD